jgi:aminopeptidase YwaD
MRVQASIRSRFYPGTFEVVEAFIPGAPGAHEILLVSHLCHPRPGANDNASGAAALLETAVTLTRLIDQGVLPAPRRGIRFIWVPEMTGTFAWLAAQEAEVRSGRWLAGLNLDMVGADQCVTKGISEFVSLPAAGAAFADHLLNWLSESFGEGNWRKEAAFASGSDHYILSDPSVGIPTPMINDWPDRFYHTSADTPDKVSPAALARSGALAALYAYWLAAADPADAAWLSHLMLSRFATSISREAAAAAESLQATRNAGARARIWTSYQRTSAFRAERMDAALTSLNRLGIEPTALAAARIQAAEAVAAEEAYVRGLVSADEARIETPAEEAGWGAEAAILLPRRLAPGPIDVGMALQADSPGLRPAYWQLNDEADETLHVGASLLQYWADGHHTVAQIADLVELETKQPMGEVALRYFKLLVEAGLMTFQRSHVEMLGFS